jgi:hypothetical protein
MDACVRTLPASSSPTSYYYSSCLLDCSALPLWRRNFRSGTAVVETGSNLDRDRGSLFVDVLPVAEGVLSLPFHLRRGQARGKCRGFSCSSSFFSCITLEVSRLIWAIVSLSSFPRSVGDDFALNSMLWQTPNLLNQYRVTISHLYAMN